MNDVKQILNPPGREVAKLLDQVESSLRFFADAGCGHAEVSEENLARVKRWGDPAAMIVTRSIEEIAKESSGCKRCPLHQTKTKVVPGQGTSTARLMFVGDYPSPEADSTGDHFAGEVGQLFSNIIDAMKLAPEDVYVTHLVKCRPPDGRVPQQAEIAACRTFLEQEIVAVAPDIICVLGGFVAGLLLETSTPLAELRGRFHDRRGVSVRPIWHPADIVTQPDKKREVWEDIQQIMRALNS